MQYEADIQQRIGSLSLNAQQQESVYRAPLVEMTEENENNQNFEEPSSQLLLSAKESSNQRRRNQTNMIKNRSACSSVDM